MELKYAKLSPDFILTSKSPALEIPDRYISELLFDGLKKHGDQVVFIEGPTGLEMTGQHVLETATRMAHSLRLLGVREGDVVFSFMPHNSDAACLVIACTFIGAVFTGCMSTYPSCELRSLVQSSEAGVILCLAADVPVAVRACEGNEKIRLIVTSDSTDGPGYELGIKVVSLKDQMSQLPAGLMEHKMPVVPLSKPPSQAVAICLYSSGTTGKAKGVLKSHRNLVAVCCDPDPVIKRLSGKRRISSHAPFCHHSGIVTLVSAIHEGNVLVFDSLFTVDAFLHSVQTHKINYALLFPTRMQMLCRQADRVSCYDVSSLEEVATAGAPLPQSIVPQFMQVMGIKHLNLIYAMTECGRTTGADVDIGLNGSVGWPRPSVQFKIVDRLSNQPLGPDSVGELMIKGPQVTIGYNKSPEADAENFTEDGWFKTGDAAYFDKDGLISIVDRYKEIIRCYPGHVAPSDLESILLTHESVSEAVVIGVPDEVHNEVPRAVVVLKGKASEEQLVSYVNDQVSEIQRLRGGVIFVDSLPKTGIGKVDRVTVKKRFAVTMKPDVKEENGEICLIISDSVPALNLH